MTSNRPIVDTGWRVGMPAFPNLNSDIIRSKTISVTCLDGINTRVTLKGYGVPEWNTVSR